MAVGAVMLYCKLYIYSATSNQACPKTCIAKPPLLSTIMVKEVYSTRLQVHNNAPLLDCQNFKSTRQKKYYQKFSLKEEPQKIIDSEQIPLYYPQSYKGTTFVLNGKSFQFFLTYYLLLYISRHNIYLGFQVPRKARIYNLDQDSLFDMH